VEETRVIFTIAPDAEIPVHPIADLIGEMNEGHVRQLIARMEKQGGQDGVLTEICIYQGQILDGRHRREACRRQGWNCPAWEYTGDHPYEKAVALNMAARNLMHTERAIYAVAMSDGLIAEAHDKMVSTLKKGASSPVIAQPKSGDDEPTQTHIRLATLFALSPSFVRDALALKSKHPDHWAKVVSGEYKIGPAYDLARGRAPRRKHNQPPPTPPDATIQAIPNWQILAPQGKKLPDWQAAFFAQQERARELHGQIAIERQKRVAAEGSVPSKARALSLKDIGAIKKQAADDVALMRRRCLMAEAVRSGAVMWGPTLAAETQLNPQQWQAFYAAYSAELVQLGVASATKATEKGG